MKKLYTLLFFAMFAACSTILISCGSDDDDDVIPTNTNGGSNGGSSTQAKNIPTGYSCLGSVLNALENLASECKAVGGDWHGFERGVNDLSWMDALHVVDGTTIETLQTQATLSRPSKYYTSKSYVIGGKSYTVYIYFPGVYDTFTYKWNGTTFVMDGQTLTYSSNTLTWGKSAYKKVNY